LNRSRNPNPNPKDEDGEERDLLPVTTVDRRMDTARQSHRRAEERPLRARGFGAQGTVATPFDGDALSLAGNAHAGEGHRGGAGSSFPPPVVMADNCCCTVRLRECGGGSTERRQQGELG
jgi:hypothetical protein